MGSHCVKRRLSFFTGALCLLLCLLTVQAAASNTVTVDVTGGSLTFDKSTGTITKGSGTALVIPAEIDGVAVTAIGPNAFTEKYGANTLTSVQFPEGLTDIGADAFNPCYNLTAVQLPGSLRSIGNSAFCNCGSLRMPDLPDGIKSIGSYAFSVGALQTYPNVSDPATVKLPASLETMEKNAFGGRYKVTAYAIAGSNASFKCVDGCLYSKDGKTFVSCPAGRAGAVSVAAGVTELAPFSFFECKNLTAVTLPEGLRTVGSWAFADCSALTSLQLPESLTTIESFSFSGLLALKELRIPKAVSTIENYAMTSCTSLERVTLPNAVTHLSSNLLDNCRALTEVFVPDGVTELSGSVFANCGAMQALALPDSLDTIYSNCLSSVSQGTFTDVYFAGDEQVWQALNIVESNTVLQSATVHYNSCGTVWDSGKTEQLRWLLRKDNSVWVGGDLSKASPAVAAVYNSAGRMLSVRILTGEGSFTASAGQNVRIYWLNAATLAPRASAVTLNIPARN